MYTQIDAWLDRRLPLPGIFANPEAIKRDSYWLSFLTIEEEVPLHEIRSVSWQSVRDSAREIQRYVIEAIQINGSDQIEEIDDKRRIIELLGPPPLIAAPIYLIVTRCTGLDSVVYIGKTKTNKRFASGHGVALKLHDKKFENCEKLVFRCSVTLICAKLFSFDDWTLIEWTPPIIAEDILDDIESHLIFWLQPELNVYKKRALAAKHKEVAIHIQHRLNQRSCLHDLISG